MRILLIGDIVGKPGRLAIKNIVPQLRKDKAVNFVIANAENAAGGSGLTPATVDELFQSQVDVLTSGDHIWNKKEIFERLDKDNRILRPANYPEACPGKGSAVLKSDSGKLVGVIGLVGRVFMKNIDCPFKCAEKEIEIISKETNIIFLDIHAEATSEKIALGRFLDGRVSCVFGTHTHVQTADEKLLPKGSAYITDVGMTGSQDSIIGRDVDSIIERFLTGMPAKFDVAEKDVELQGAIVELDDRTGKAVRIERVMEKIGDYL